MRASSRHRVGWAMGLGVALTTVAATAVAEPPANNNGAMTFPNVTVVNMPEAQPAKAAAVPASGLRAYVQDGKLRVPNAEEMQAAAAAAPAAKTARAAPVAKRSAAVAEAASAPEAFVTSTGALLTLTNDEDNVFQVAHKTDGGLVVQEAVGAKAADKAAKAAPKTEVSHDR